jgi:hypothetical protein
MLTKLALVLAAGLVTAASSFAAAPPSDAPAGTTGMCKDGSYWSGAEKKGACKGHKGVKDWYGSTDTAAPAKSDAKAETKDESKSEATTAAAAKSGGGSKPAATPAPGGGPGMVWANDSSKVYHCQGDKWYGTTKHGEYMSEADAKSKGFHPDHGKACGKS